MIGGLGTLELGNRLAGRGGRHVRERERPQESGQSHAVPLLLRVVAAPSDNSDHKGNFGLHFCGTLFAAARQDFWVIPPPERGIDGLVGICIGGQRTGAFIGVQVKCGASYFENGRPVLKASTANFAYWAGARMPFIGVVVSETEQTAHWFYLTEPTAFGQANSATRVSLTAGVEHRLDPGNAADILRVALEKFEGGTKPFAALDGDNYLGDVPSDSDNDEERLSEAETWTLLLDRLTGAGTAPEVRANAGHRLSWYFPRVPEERKREAKERMQQLSDEGLAGILDCVAMLIEEEAPHAAELVTDMLTYSERPIGRINDLVAAGCGTARARELAYQVVDNLQAYEE